MESILLLGDHRMENDHKSLSLREWRLLACRLCKPLVKLSNMSSLSKHLIALLISGCYWLDSGDTNVTQVDGDARKAPPPPPLVLLMRCKEND